MSPSIDAGLRALGAMCVLVASAVGAVLLTAALCEVGKWLVRVWRARFPWGGRTWEQREIARLRQEVVRHRAELVRFRAAFWRAVDTQHRARADAAKYHRGMQRALARERRVRIHLTRLQGAVWVYAETWQDTAGMRALNAPTNDAFRDVLALLPRKDAGR